MVQHDNKVRRYNGHSIEVEDAGRENSVEVLYEKRNPYLLDYEEERRKQVYSQRKAGGSRRQSTVGDRGISGRRAIGGYEEDMNGQTTAGYGEGLNRRNVTGYEEGADRRSAVGYEENVNRRGATGYGENVNRRGSSGYEEGVNRHSAVGYGEDVSLRSVAGYREDINRHSAAEYGESVNSHTVAGNREYGKTDNCRPPVGNKKTANRRSQVEYVQTTNRRVTAEYSRPVSRRIPAEYTEPTNRRIPAEYTEPTNRRVLAEYTEPTNRRVTAEYEQSTNRRVPAEYTRPVNRRSTARHAEASNRRPSGRHASNHAAAARRSAKYRRRKRILMQRMAVSIWALCILCLAVILFVNHNRAAAADRDKKENQSAAINDAENVQSNPLATPTPEPVLVQGIPATEYAKHPEWTEDFLTPNEYSRPGDPLESVTNIFVHYTANPGTSAAQNRSYFERQKDEHLNSVSSHFIIGYEGEIIQCVPLDEVAYAVKTRNYDSISIECCHLATDGSFTQQTYDSLLALLRWLLDVYDLETEDILRHYDCGGKKCPLYYTDHPDAWEELKKDVDKL